MSFGSRLPFVTVIVPAYNAHSVLPACLKRLTEQTYPRDCYEIIVVDNGSTPSLEPLVAQSPGVIYLTEEKPSSYAARNRGIENAKGEVFAFTDADCEPYLDWLERGVCRLRETPGCGLVGGHIQLAFQKPHTPTIFEFSDYLCHGEFPQQYFIEVDHYAATANAFMPRATMEKVGPFNPNLRSSGDLEWGNRAHAAGYELVYAPEAVVLHPARSRMEQLVKKARRLQGGSHDLWERMGRPKPQVSFKRRVTPPVIVWLRDDYLKMKDYPRAMGSPLRLSLLRALGAAVIVVVLRSIRSLERVRLALGAASFRG